MLFSLNANFFGPRSQSDPQNAVASALTLFQQTGIPSAFFCRDIDASGNVSFEMGGLVTKLTRATFTELKHIKIIFGDGVFADEDSILAALNEFPDRFFSMESIVITDYFFGNDDDFPIVATNFPIMRRDWRNSRVFSTKQLPLADNLNQAGNYHIKFEEFNFSCYEDLIYTAANMPMYKNAELCWASAEPFGVWAESGPQSIQGVEVVKGPVIALLHPFSANFNIFFHETILPALLVTRFPADFRFLVRGDSFRLEALRRLGVSDDRVILAPDMPLRFERILFPQRRLNLKYVGLRLRQMYSLLTESIHAEFSDHPNSNRVIYLDRMNSKQNTGVNRFILNNAEILEEFRRHSAKIVYLEESSLVEKAQILSGADTVVTTIGANLVNVALARDIQRVVLIVSPLWGHFLNYWISVLKMRHPMVKIDVVRDCVVEDNGLSADPFNKPYRVNVTSLFSTIYRN